MIQSSSTSLSTLPFFSSSPVPSVFHINYHTIHFIMLSVLPSAWTLVPADFCSSEQPVLSTLPSLIIFLLYCPESPPGSLPSLILIARSSHFYTAFSNISPAFYPFLFFSSLFQEYSITSHLEKKIKSFFIAKLLVPGRV